MHATRMEGGETDLTMARGSWGKAWARYCACTAISHYAPAGFTNRTRSTTTTNNTTSDQEIKKDGVLLRGAVMERTGERERGGFFSFFTPHFVAHVLS